ncbi:DUF6789 family protein [Catalinimonas niigatensis]|uniref:DUF6789 family protein n=1 Tax=Catalinimonas niigatensis TaxID=1397264 RepID=UPI00266649C7|nr:DUF6789 family protein [Catalinimonas niigatensis]WPP50320.1 hypothetical protein PZB72_27005 [Catalinimonas niigatensis]
MMEKSLFKKIVYPALSATSTMTMFSYAVSYLVNDQFKEPKLLSSLFLSPGRQKANEPPVGGFLLHYLVGMIFATVYQLFWKHIFRFPKWKDGIIYGTVCGLIGMLTWKLTFTLHKSPPDIKLKSYLFHLLIAHLIFGVTLTWTERKLGRKS